MKQRSILVFLVVSLSFTSASARGVLHLNSRRVVPAMLYILAGSSLFSWFFLYHAIPEVKKQGAFEFNNHVDGITYARPIRSLKKIRVLHASLEFEGSEIGGIASVTKTLVPGLNVFHEKSLVGLAPVRADIIVPR